MTTITIDSDVFAQHIHSLIEVMRMPNTEHVADAHNKAVRFLRAALAAQQPAPAWHDAPEREAFDALIKDAEHIHVPSAEKAWQAACAWQKRKDEAICAGFSQEAYNRYRASRREYDDGLLRAANALADKIRGVE